jgi:hypothetical protein
MSNSTRTFIFGAVIRLAVRPRPCRPTSVGKLRPAPVTDRQNTVVVRGVQIGLEPSTSI